MNRVSVDLFNTIALQFKGKYSPPLSPTHPPFLELERETEQVVTAYYADPDSDFMSVKAGTVTTITITITTATLLTTTSTTSTSALVYTYTHIYIYIYTHIYFYIFLYISM